MKPTPNSGTRPSLLKRQLRKKLLDEWVGPSMTKPRSHRDQAASILAKAATRFTKESSLISPVAVAAIDILGMKSLLENRSLEDVAEQFAEPFYDLHGPAYKFGRSSFSQSQLVRMGYKRGAGIYSVVVSDTILLVRRPDWEEGTVAAAESNAVISLAQYVCKVIRVNSLYDIRLRAAISFGDCIVNIGGGLACLGTPTAEASGWERQQEWIGGMLTPSAVAVLRRGAEAAKRKLGADFRPAYPNFLVQYPVPLKRGCILPPPQIALNWVAGLLPGLGMSGHVPNLEGDAREDVKRKLANTIEFAAHCETLGVRPNSDLLI